MKTLKITALALVCAGLALPASAELKGKNELTVQAGAMKYEGDANIDTGLIYGARIGHFFTERISAELSVLAGKTETDGGADVTSLHPALAASYHFRFGKFMPFLQAGAGLLRLKPEGGSANSDLALHWGGGLKYFYKPDFLLRADLDHVIDTEIGKGTHDLEATVGVSWLFGMPGSKAAEAARKTAEDAKNKAIEDAKRAADAAKNKALEDARKAAEAARLKAEEEARLAADKLKAAVAGDTDKDGVTDDKDECAGTAAGTAVDAKGCPQGTKEIPADNWVLKGVTFEIGSDVIKAEGKAILDEAAAILLPRTSVRLEVQGHTDNTGNAASNVTLSEKRAAAVKAYLVAKGVAADRLEAKGYGATMPVADNATAAGRDANRRIEFKVLSR